MQRSATAMADGFIYVLKNPHMPSLVKIGYTERSPQVRAAELSNHTGVPGNFSVVKSWRIRDAAIYERKIFAELRSYRSTGEHFELSPTEAVKRINVLLRAWGEIGEDGLTETERIEAIQRRQSLEEAEKARKQRNLIRQILAEIRQSEAYAEDAARQACAPALKARRIRALVIWTTVCTAAVIALGNVGPERGSGVPGALIWFGFWFWFFGALVAWFGSVVPGYEGVKQSACGAARRSVLAKHGLPPTWRPPF